MRVFKFGGASVKSAKAVRNVADIIQSYSDEKLVIVVSAMGKTTNAMEWLVNTFYHEPDRTEQVLQQTIDFHDQIVEELFPDKEHVVYNSIQSIYEDLRNYIAKGTHGDYDHDYDQLVSKGEVLSTTIIAHYLDMVGVNTHWVDSRLLIATDDTYREGKVDWNITERNITAYFDENADQRIYITQGFLGSNAIGHTTTLGREGSDFSAAIFAYCLDASSVTIWKDVPGVLNADPKWFDNTVKLDRISFYEAIELSYYGATIIHPKTIKPLQNKNIPLFAKSFVSPEDPGTEIQESREFDDVVPSFIFKVDQILISISPKDFSFIIEENLERIFRMFAKHRVRMSLMQNSALNFSVCADMDTEKIQALLRDLGMEFSVRYNENLELVTIRHYDDATINRVTENKKILVDQRTRQTARMVMVDRD